MVVGLFTLLPGCTRITISPECPETLRVGESGNVRANELTPGAIATYLWEVFPAEAGTFSNASQPNTSFEAAMEGTATLRLTASDGLFQVIDECTTTISGVEGAGVAMSANPNPALVGDTVTLTCTDNGTLPAVVLAITQTDGGNVDLSQTGSGTASFITTEIGDLEFRCVGEAEGGVQSEPAFVTISVTQSDPDDDNGLPGRDPPRPGR